MPPPLVATRALCKTLCAPDLSPILREIDLEVAAGETVAIIGASGVGKTTLLHILALLEAPTSGTIEIEGMEVHSSNGTNLRRDVLAVIFQFFHLIESWSALDNALLPAQIAKEPLAPARERCWQLLQEMRLEHRADTPAGKLSGGEKQRLCLARALLRRPRLLLADEFTGNLDRETSDLVADLLFEQVERDGASLILATHDLDLARRCQTHYRIEGGRLHALAL